MCLNILETSDIIKNTNPIKSSQFYIIKNYYKELENMLFTVTESNYDYDYESVSKQNVDLQGPLEVLDVIPYKISYTMISCYRNLCIFWQITDNMAE